MSKISRINDALETMSFENVREKFYPFVHNLFSAVEENAKPTQQLMAKCPSITTSGVCVFFSVLLEETSTRAVTTYAADKWGVETPELYQIAMENLEKLPMRLNKVEEEEFYVLDTSCAVWPSLESARFLSRKSMEEAQRVVGGDFYIFPVSAWKSYLMTEEQMKGMTPSTALTYMFAKGGLPADILLRHGYLYKEHRLQLVELTASREKGKKIMVNKKESCPEGFL